MSDFLSVSPTSSISWTDATPPGSGPIIALGLSQDGLFIASSDGTTFNVSDDGGATGTTGGDGASSISVGDGIGVGPGINFSTIANGSGITKNLQAVTAASTGVYASLIISSAQANGLDPDTFARQLFQESGTTISGGVALFNPSAVSPAGAKGIAQFVSPLPSSLGAFNPLDPTQAIPKAAQYMSQLMGDFGGNIGLALGAYNGGPGFMRSYLLGQVAADPETLAYVQGITGVSLPAWATPGFVLAEYDVATSTVRLSGSAGAIWLNQSPTPGVLASSIVAISGDGKHAIAAGSDGHLWTWY